MVIVGIIARIMSFLFVADAWKTKNSPPHGMPYASPWRRSNLAAERGRRRGAAGALKRD